MLILLLGCSSVALAAEYVPYEGGEDVALLDDSGIMPLSAGSITPSYGVGTSNISLFAGVVSKLPYGDHYVYWRSGQYTYMLAHGRGLVYEGGRFSAPEVQFVQYYTYTGGSTQATYSQSTDSNFTLSPGNYLVYSDLGDYPELETGRREREYVQTACIGIAVMLLLSVLRTFWACLRRW